MKFSINIWSFPPTTPINKALEAAAKNDYNGFEVAITREDIKISREKLREKFIKIKEKMNELNLEAPTIATGLYWHSNIALPSEWKNAFKILRRQLEAAQILEAKVILIIPGVAIPEIEYEKLMKNTVLWLKRASKITSKHNVTIGIENVWNKMYGSPLEFKKLLD